MSSANRKSRWPIPLLVFGAICLVASFVTLPTIKALLKKQAELDTNKWLNQAERDANSTWTEDDAASWLHQHGFDKVHIGKAVSDHERFEDEWAYFRFTDKEGKLVDKARPFPKASCYDCHRHKGADDNVFTQFYPVLKATNKK